MRSSRKRYPAELRSALTWPTTHYILCTCLFPTRIPVLRSTHPKGVSTQIRLTLLTLAVVLSTPAVLPATSVILSFGTLPSAQGFTYDNSGNPVPESTIFSVDGTTLTQNSLGQPDGPSHNIYRFNDIVNDTDPFTLKVRARMLDDEPTDSIGFFFSVNTGTERPEVFFGTDSLRSPSTVSITSAIDTSLFHDYRIEGTPGVAMFDLYVDDNLVAGSISASPTSENYIGLGDPTGSANAHAEITHFEFTQVPEPSSLLLCSAIVTMGLVCLRSRRRVLGSG